MSKIARLEFRNVLGIEEREIQAGKINIISGKNEAGKTSILESIEKAIYNTERRAKFVREGQAEGTLYVELDDGLSIDRKVKEDGSGRVKVEKNGASVPKPETYLKNLVGGFSFNPVDFMGKKDKEQTEILLSLIPMKVTKEQLEEWFGEVPPVALNQHALEVLNYLSEKYFYDKRHIANGEVRECQSEIDAIRCQLPDNYKGDDYKAINIGDLWRKVQEAEKINQTREKAHAVINDLEDKIETIEARYRLKTNEVKEYSQFKVDKAKKDAEVKRQEFTQLIEGLKESVVITKEQIKIEILAIEEEIRQLQLKIERKKVRLSEIDTETANGIKMLEKDIEGIDKETALIVNGIEQERDKDIASIEDKKAEEIEAAKAHSQKATEYLEDKPEIDTEPLKAQAEEAEKMKGFISLWENLQNLRINLGNKQKAASKLDDCVRLAREIPAQLIAKANMPVKGLGINTEGSITIDGLPIKNLSTSRQIKLALDIARATAGSLKIVCIDRFESLDPPTQAEFFKQVEKDNFQYFITTVTDGDLKIESRGGLADGTSVKAG